jgi:hypothetical protein
MEKINYHIDLAYRRRFPGSVLDERAFSEGLGLRSFGIFLLLMLFNNLQLRCDEIQSANSGPWSEPETWDGNAVPDSSNQVIILTNHAITLDMAAVVNSLAINSGAELILNDDLSISKLESEITANLIVESGAIIDTRTFRVVGSGGFVLNNGGTLKTSHPQGVSHNSNTGCIQTNERNFGLAAIYHYTGTENQLSGNALPMASAPKVIIVELANDNIEFRINTSGVILISESGRFEIRSGTIVEGDTGGGGRSVEGAGMLVMKGGIFKSERTNTVSTTIDFPRLTGEYSNGSGGPMLGSIVLAGVDRYQRIKSGRTYNNIVFTGEGTKRIPDATPNINGTVTIENGVVDAQNFAFGNDETNLTMTGGKLITSSIGISPDMGGIYTITGGTIEFANTSSTLQTIRRESHWQHFNIDISGTSVGNSNGQIRIQSGGTFTIKGDGIFRFNAYFLSGEGSFVMETNSTLLIGSEYGIKTSGESAADGNIRVSGDRTFSPLANYGFIGSYNQVTGNALPLVVNRLIIDKEGSSNVVLSQDVTVSGELILNQGILVTGGEELYLSNPQVNSLVAGEGNSDFNNGFIRGALKRQVADVNANYYFPIGLSSTPQTATVNFNPGQLTGTDPMTLKTEFLPPPANYYGNLPQPLGGVQINNLSDVGFWQITPESISTAEYSLSLSTSGSPVIPVPSGIRIVKREQGELNWEMAGENPSYSGPGPAYTFIQENITGFSEFAIGGDVNQNPLPVEWLSMEVSQADGAVILKWQTATETNNHYFSIQRSSNGIDFNELGEITGAGNSNKILSYSFADHDPLPGLAYYRIKQTDFDGKYSYSRVVAWHNQINPEPAILIQHQQIHIQIPETRYDSWNYEIYSITGTLISSGEIMPGTNGMIDASSFRNQLLLVVLSDGVRVLPKKVMVR